MTQEEALEIIAKAKPIVLPSSATSIDNKKIITSFKSIIKNGKERRKMPKEKY